MKVLLKNGLIVDGSGKAGFRGDVLIEDALIRSVSHVPIIVEACKTIDCSGKVVAPGFIDAHSHNDRAVCLKNDLPYLEPFIRQGITTFVAGNCGRSVVGSEHNRLFLWETPDDEDTKVWETYHEYFDHVRKHGIRQNMVLLAGHETAHISVMGNKPIIRTPLEQRKKIERVLEEGLDAGCKGISFGLGYSVCKMMDDEEIREISELAIKRNAVISIHSRTLNVSLPQFYGDDYSEPHNIRWHREFFERFRDSGAKLQVAHLVFMGSAAWPTFDRFFEMFDTYMNHKGIDLWFDMYNYTQGTADIGLLLTPYFYKNIDDIYDNPDKIRTLQKEMQESFHLKGYDPSLMQVCNGYSMKYKKYQGQFFPEVEKKTGMSVTDLIMDIYRESGGAGTIYTLFDQKEEDINIQMTHPHALYATDGWYEPSTHQNACTYGAMPKYLHLARESGNITIEECVAHMTGMTADRYNMHGRGYLRDGYFADIVVFNPKTVTTKATFENPDIYPIGIEHVFVNGGHLFDDGKLNTEIRSGYIV